MLKKLIKQAQNGDKNAMQKLIDRFFPLLIKYALKLNYEDAYPDLILYYIELIKSIKLENISCHKDEIIISYINVSIKNIYSKEVQKRIIAKKEIVLSDLTEEQAYYVEVHAAKEDDTDIFYELGIQNELSAEECRIIYLVYIDGYTIAEIARKSMKSRQAVNQVKQRALKKIKNYLIE